MGPHKPWAIRRLGTHTYNLRCLIPDPTIDSESHAAVYFCAAEAAHHKLIPNHDLAGTVSIHCQHTATVTYLSIVMFVIMTGNNIVHCVSAEMTVAITVMQR